MKIDYDENSMVLSITEINRTNDKISVNIGTDDSVKIRVESDRLKKAQYIRIPGRSIDITKIKMPKRIAKEKPYNGSAK